MDLVKPPATLATVPFTMWLLLGAALALFAWRWYLRLDIVPNGEPPIVPYQIPWLGHALSFMNDINGFATWAR